MTVSGSTVCVTPCASTPPLEPAVKFGPIAVGIGVGSRTSNAFRPNDVVSGWQRKSISNGRPIVGTAFGG